MEFGKVHWTSFNTFNDLEVLFKKKKIHLIALPFCWLSLLQRRKFHAAHHLSTHPPRPISRKGWTLMTWSRLTISSGNSLWRGTVQTHAFMYTWITASQVYLQTHSLSHLFVFVFCVQAISSVSVLLLQDQLVPEAGTGVVLVRWQPAEGHYSGWRQRQWHLHLICPAGLHRWEGRATRGPPPPVGM